MVVVWLASSLAKQVVLGPYTRSQYANAVPIGDEYIGM